MKKTLQNPWVLMAQGFVAGVFLFWSSLPAEGEAPIDSTSVQAAALAQNFDA